MATATIHAPVATGVQPKSNMLHRVVDWVSAWSEREKARALLSNMSERDLKDIGISRSQIDEAIRKAPYAY